MSRYIDEHRGRFGVEPICRALGVSASAYYQRATGQRSARAVRRERLSARIREVHRANYGAYGYKRGRVDAGRDQVAALMRRQVVAGAKRRGKPWRTTRVRASYAEGELSIPKSGKVRAVRRSTSCAAARRA